MVRGGRRKQAPTWGPGAFVVQPGAKLALARLTLETVVTMDAGALAFSLTDCAIGFADVLVLTAATASFHGVVFQVGRHPIATLEEQRPNMIGTLV